jgi:hypothetical protein
MVGESDILLWVESDGDGVASSNSNVLNTQQGQHTSETQVFGTPLKLIYLRAALANAKASELSKSIELALQGFDRARIDRLIQNLNERGLIQVIQRHSQSTVCEEDLSKVASPTDLLLKLTDSGKEEVKRLKDLAGQVLQ